MRRRKFIALLGAAAAWPLTAAAQRSGRMRLIGVLLGVSATDREWQRRVAAFAHALKDFGWTEGNTFTFVARYAEGNPERLPALAVELVQDNVDVIVTQGSEPVDAARKATSTIPIVTASVGDAVGMGLVASLARPGGNITGLTLVATEQGTKRLELAKEIIPSLSGAIVIWNGNNASHRLQLKGMEAVASHFGIALQSRPVRNADDIDAAFQAATQHGSQAVITMEDPLIVQVHRMRIVESAIRQRLPVVGEFRPIVTAGALVSYGPDQVEMWRRAASFVDKIFKGAKPSDLPVEQPTKFELVINLKTANALGITIPPTLLARADEVIE